MLNFIIKQSLLSVSLVIFWGASIYYLFALTPLGIVFTFILTILTLIILKKLILDKETKTNTFNLLNTKFPKTNLLTISYFLISIYFLEILISHSTNKAIISPWEILPGYFFVVYALLLLILFFNIKKTPKLILPLFSLHVFLTYSIALIIYKIGYGFDPFIHSAALDLIDKTGLVMPKTLYYSGYYALITIFHKISFIPLTYLNKIIVLVFASLTLPWAFINLLDKIKTDIKIKYLSLFSLLIFPCTFLINSTPQNLAYIFLLLVIVLSFKIERNYDFILLCSLSLASFMIHPIVGIPAILYTASLIGTKLISKKFIKLLILSLTFILASIVLPLAFIYLGNNNETLPEAADSSSQSVLSNLTMPWHNFFDLNHFPNRENPWLNFVYFYKNNLAIILLGLIAFGLFLLISDKGKRKEFALYILFSIALLVSYFLTKLLPFAFLISYERTNYTERILLIAIFFALPLIILGLVSFISQIIKQNKKTQIIFLIFSLLFICASFYLTYPRLDNYFNSRGFSVGDIDIEAVEWIENKSLEDFVVLANQQVSAAALNEFGFKKYYPGNIFYYPIPTGGPLYQIYLDMVYDKPTRANAFKASQLTGVNDVYFVLNKYWWAFTKIRDEAQLFSDDAVSFGEGDIWVFKYSF